jgi:long-chain fatty acid transport protein
MPSRLRVLLLAVAIDPLCGVSAQAAGFALKEQSAAGLGSAFAGQAAGGEDIGAMFVNPASLTRYENSRVSVVATYIMPQVRFRDGSASGVTGAPTGGGNGGSDAADDLMLPAAYALWDLEEALGWGHKLRFGVGVNVPFGLETDYNDGWVGRYHALRSQLATLNVNPVVAFEVVRGLSLGVGGQLQYADATLTNAVDFGTIGAVSGVPFALPGRQDGRARVTGDDWGYGFTLGALLEPWTGSRIGVGYRSAVKHRLSGRGSFRLDDAGVGATLSAATGAFTNTDAEADLTTPESVTIGVTQELGQGWSVSGEAQWTRWSRFDDLTIKFANPAQPTSFTEEDWEDVWFLAFGLTWRPNDAWALRAGYAYDQSPVPRRTATPRIPDSDRHWLAVGASYRPVPALLLAAGYTHIFMRDGEIDLSADAPGETFRGNLSGRTRSAIDMVSLQAEWQF